MDTGVGLIAVSEGVCVGVGIVVSLGVAGGSMGVPVDGLSVRAGKEGISEGTGSCCTLSSASTCASRS